PGQPRPRGQLQPPGAARRRPALRRHPAPSRRDHVAASDRVAPGDSGDRRPDVSAALHAGAAGPTAGGARRPRAYNVPGPGRRPDLAQLPRTTGSGMTDLGEVEARLRAVLNRYRPELVDSTIYGVPSLVWPGATGHDYFVAIK